MNKDNKSIAIIIFPAVLMLCIHLLIYASPNFLISELGAKDLIINSIILFFPMLFVIQGILVSFTKRYMLLSLGSSVVAYSLFTMIFMNATAFGYIFVYIVFWFIGFGAVRLIWFFKRGARMHKQK